MYTICISGFLSVWSDWGEVCSPGTGSGQVPWAKHPLATEAQQTCSWKVPQLFFTQKKSSMCTLGLVPGSEQSSTAGDKWGILLQKRITDQIKTPMWTHLQPIAAKKCKSNPPHRKRLYHHLEMKAGKVLWEQCYRSDTVPNKVNATASQKLFIMIQLDFQGGFKTI